jgi:hypothetical protein
VILEIVTFQCVKKQPIGKSMEVPKANFAIARFERALCKIVASYIHLVHIGLVFFKALRAALCPYFEDVNHSNVYRYSHENVFLSDITLFERSYSEKRRKFRSVLRFT